MSVAVSLKPGRRTATAMRWIFGIYFVAVGLVHFVVPEGLPPFMAWMYELSDSLHVIAGTAEILGGLGLVLPNLFGIAPRLAGAAAAGLTLLMIGAAAWHLGRGEWVQIFGNLAVAGLLAYVAVGERRGTTRDTPAIRPPGSKVRTN
jgi:uncharacterized membrane protein